MPANASLSVSEGSYWTSKHVGRAYTVFDWMMPLFICNVFLHILCFYINQIYICPPPIFIINYFGIMRNISQILPLIRSALWVNCINYDELKLDISSEGCRLRSDSPTCLHPPPIWISGFISLLSYRQWATTTKPSSPVQMPVSPLSTCPLLPRKKKPSVATIWRSETPEAPRHPHSPIS